jgi:hypothetical protein
MTLKVVFNSFAMKAYIGLSGQAVPVADIRTSSRCGHLHATSLYPRKRSNMSHEV